MDYPNFVARQLAPAIGLIDKLQATHKLPRQNWVRGYSQQVQKRNDATLAFAT